MNFIAVAVTVSVSVSVAWFNRHNIRSLFKNERAVVVGADNIAVDSVTAATHNFKNGRNGVPTLKLENERSAHVNIA